MKSIAWFSSLHTYYLSFIISFFSGNLVEAFICVLIVMNVFKTVRLTKLVTLFASIMTAYKTFLFFLYSFDIGQGGREMTGWWNEFLVFGLGLVWLLVPLYVIWVVTPDFLDNAVKSSTSLSARKLSNTSYDSAWSTSGTKMMNDFVDSGIKTPSVTKTTTTTTTQRSRAKTTETPAQKTPSRRYNLRER